MLHVGEYTEREAEVAFYVACSVCGSTHVIGRFE